MAKIVDLAGVLTYEPSDFCFGYLEDTDTLYLGHSHHALIIAELIGQGMTWEQLLNSRQMWGWAEYLSEAYPDEGESTTPILAVGFSTDEAKQDIGIRDKVVAALHQTFPDYDIEADSHAHSTVGIGQYGDRAKEQYLGEEPYYGHKVAENEVEPSWKDNPELKSSGCFGCVNGHLVFGDKHHQLIIAAFLNHGWSWAQLNKAEQAWGWYQISAGRMNLTFASDAGVQSSAGVDAAEKAFEELYHMPVFRGSVHGVSQEQYGKGLKGKGNLRSYLRGGSNDYMTDRIKGVPAPPPRVEWNDEKEERFKHLEGQQHSNRITPEESNEFLNLWIDRQSAAEEREYGDIHNSDDDDDEDEQTAYCSYCDEYYNPDYEDHDHTEYCDHCDTYYDPEEEAHDHDIQYCRNCDEYYDNNDYYYSNEHDHFKVKEDWNNANTKEWFQKAYEQAKENIESGYTVDPKSQEEIASDTKDWLVDEHDFDKENAEWLSEAVGDMLATQNSKIENPSWVPKGLHIVQPQQNKPLYQPGQKLKPIDTSPQGYLIPQGAPPVGSVLVFKSYTTQYDMDSAQKRYIIGYNANGPILSFYPPEKQQYGTKFPITWAELNESFKVYNKTSQRLARVTDLHDEKVFAILSHDYLKYSEEGGAINTNTPIADRTIEHGSKWVDPQGMIHTVTGLSNNDGGSGRVYYNHSSGHGNMSQAGWHYYMKPLDPTAKPSGSTNFDIVDGWSEAPFPEKGTTPLYHLEPWSPADLDQHKKDLMAQESIDPQAEGALKDDPRLLAIERNPASAEWRWSMDDNQLHIWRVLNRWQYGPSHYDMFGSEGYTNHSQGRVYVDPNGEVGVLYWQISHPQAEQTLNDWVEQKFGKQPDLVYRAYGGYKGYKTPRYDFPIVEVSGLPIGKSQRWWERGERPRSYYQDLGLPTPSKQKGEKVYPAKSQKAIVQGDEQYSNNPAKAKRRKRRSRGRSKQYRNRGRR